MSTEPTHRLAQLPGFDTAPDVYETPDLDDSATTASTLPTSPRESSEASETSDDAEEDDEDGDERFGISRRRLYPERARSKFGGVEGRRVDLSDRVDGRRRGYAVRQGEGGEEEGLEGRIARLRREVEECRILIRDKKEERDEDEDISALSTLLAGLDIPTPSPRKPRRKAETTEAPEIFHDALPTPSTDPSPIPQISTLESRLTHLEAALGLTPTTPTAPPLLPTLTLLDQQLSALTTLTSTPAFESRIAALKSSLPQTDESPSPSTEDQKSLTALYALLPTLHALAPTVPALLSRLRSLHGLHAAAATAGSDLEGLEQRVGELEREMKMWREGLGRVEAAVKEANRRNAVNGGVLKGWVEELGGRVEALGR